MKTPEDIFQTTYSYRPTIYFVEPVKRLPAFSCFETLPNAFQPEFRRIEVPYEVAQILFVQGYQAAQPQWISVNDRLPEEGLEVLVFGKVLNDISKILGVRARYKGDQEWKYTWESEDTNSFDQDDVTHWMPLPDVVKEEK